MKEERKIKCVIWDLDNTIWDGVLLEDDNVTLKEGILEILTTLDERGILLSIASKNDYACAEKKLKEFGINELFIYPQISWEPKSNSIKEIAKLINISQDCICFIDDQSFELDQVKYFVPEILCINSLDLKELLKMPELNPRFITIDSKYRRLMYMNDILRNNDEKNFDGNQEEFLATLGMKFTISNVNEVDLQRAEELTVRTHQLNSTGYTFSFEDLDQIRKSKNHIFLISSLLDKYGDYGKIGLVLVECDEKEWKIKLLLMSCRVISRGVGTLLLNYILKKAKEANVRLIAEFVPTEKNRAMFITYKFAGFKENKIMDGRMILENDLTNIQKFPEYIEVLIE